MTTEQLKQSIFDLVAQCHAQLAEGAMVDMAPVEDGVRAYCEALAGLPIIEGKRHVDDLETLMKMVEDLGKELTTAREAVRGELESLGRLRNANVAYQKSDAIGEIYMPKEEGEK